MHRLLIDHARVILTDRIAEDWAVLCAGGRIAWVGPSRGRPCFNDGDVVDAQGQYLAPGFIDLHIHGCGEWLVDDGPQALAAMSRLLPRYGVTAFLAAVCPRLDGRDVEFIAELAPMQDMGAEVTGFFVEGLYLALSGALPPEAIGRADAALVRRLAAIAGPRLLAFAVSPELPDAPRLIEAMCAAGTYAFITHTRANVAQTQAALEAGARHATHFYDVFYAPPESDPGVRPCGAVEAILADPRASVDFILDGEHVDPVAVRMALECKGPDRVCLVTDANRGAGLPPGRYCFGRHQVEFTYEGGPARFTAEHPSAAGGLAGSGLTMDRAVRNAIKYLGVELPLAIRMAATNPAQVLGLGARKGRIAPGLDADLVLLDDALIPVQTWIGGRQRFLPADEHINKR